MASLSKIRKNYSKIRAEFDAISPNGYTLSEICTIFRQKYPAYGPRDVANYVCGQKSFANFKIIGSRINSATGELEAVYASHNPTKAERLNAKMDRCLEVAKQAKSTYSKCFKKLKKLNAGESVQTTDLWDLSDDQ